MSARTKLILAGVGAFLICLAFYFFFVKPRSAELQETKDQVAAAEAETSGLQAQLQDLRELREQAPRLEAELNEFTDLVPPTDETAIFMLAVQDAATAAGVPFMQIDPEDPKTSVEGAPLAQVKATIAAQGGYFSVQDFIRRLSELDRAVSIDSIQLSVVEGEEEAEDEGRISATLVVRVFFEIPEVQAPVTSPGELPTTTETPAPGTTPAPTDGAAPAAPEAGTSPAGTGAPQEQAG